MMTIKRTARPSLLQDYDWFRWLTTWPLLNRLFSVKSCWASPSMGHKNKEVDGPEVIVVFWLSSWEAQAALLFNTYSGSQHNQKNLRARKWINSTAGFNPFLTELLTHLLKVWLRQGSRIQVLYWKHNANVWWKRKERRKDFALQIRDKYN